jgi:hypothetical protein
MVSWLWNFFGFVQSSGSKVVGTLWRTEVCMEFGIPMHRAWDWLSTSGEYEYVELRYKWVPLGVVYVNKFTNWFSLNRKLRFNTPLVK